MLGRSSSPGEGTSNDQDNRPRPSLRDPNNPFNSLTGVEFLRKFRLSKGTAVMVLHELQSSRLPHDELPLPLQFLSALTYYGTGHCATAEAMLGVDGPTVQSIIRDVSMAVCNSLRDRYLSFPDNHELSTFQDDFYNIAQIPRVIGCVVNMYVPVKLYTGREVGVNDLHYGDQFLKVLVVCGPQGQVMHIIVQNHDVYHDWLIFCESMLLMTLTQGEYGEVVLLVDESYPIHPHLLRPIDALSTVSHELFNLCHFVTWHLTKKKFQKIITRFPCLTGGMEAVYPTNLDIVTACAVLHNVCLRFRTPLPVPRPREPDLDPDAGQAQPLNQSYITEE